MTATSTCAFTAPTDGDTFIWTHNPYRAVQVHEIAYNHFEILGGTASQALYVQWYADIESNPAPPTSPSVLRSLKNVNDTPKQGDPQGYQDVILTSMGEWKRDADVSLLTNYASVSTMINHKATNFLYVSDTPNAAAIASATAEATLSYSVHGD